MIQRARITYIPGSSDAYAWYAFDDGVTLSDERRVSFLVAYNLKGLMALGVSRRAWPHCGPRTREALLRGVIISSFATRTCEKAVFNGNHSLSKVLLLIHEWDLFVHSGRILAPNTGFSTHFASHPYFLHLWANQSFGPQTGVWLGVEERAYDLLQNHQTLHFVQSDIMVQRTRITYIPGCSDAMSGMHWMQVSGWLTGDR